MTLRLALLVMVALLAAPSAYAQADDDFLVPLTPTPKSSPASSKTKPKKGKAAKPVAAKPPKKEKLPSKKATAKKGSAAAKASPVEATKPPATAQKPSAPAQEDDLGLAPLVAAKTELLVKLAGGAIKGARLLVDNKDVGPLPQPAQVVTPGEHSVVVRRPGFSEFSKRIYVEEGQLNEVSAALEPVAGVVAVTADVPGAAVFIDGEPRGTVPLSGLLIKPGSHTLEARRDGFEADPKTIAVRAGRDYTVDFHLRPSVGGAKTAVASADRPTSTALTPREPAQVDTAAAALDTDATPEVEQGRPLTKRWYFWAGVGVVAAAAAVGAVVATQGNTVAAPLTDRDVCGGDCDAAINYPPTGASAAGVVRF
ncbi:PEGA domain-containing protein [Myxococcaceae bacterium GXIMD 01537]